MGMQEQLDQIRERMADACTRASRAVDDVRLLAVSKTYPPERVGEAVACGLTVFGESRVYEAEAKIAACPGHAEWELIGHLQRNKVRKVLPLVEVLHSVDSVKLARQIDRVAVETG